MPLNKCVVPPGIQANYLKVVIVSLEHAYR